MKDPRYLKYFMTLCPTYHFLDRADSYYARSMQFEKDYAAILSSAWDIDTALNDFITTPDADTSDLMHMLGLDEKDDAMKEVKLRRLLESNLTKGSFKERYTSPFPWMDEKPK